MSSGSLILFYAVALLLIVALVALYYVARRPAMAAAQTPIAVYLNLVQQLNRRINAFTLSMNPADGTYNNYYVEDDPDADEHLALTVEPWPVNYEGVPVRELIEHGTIVKELNGEPVSNGFYVTGIEGRFECPTLWTWSTTANRCTPTAICQPDDVRVVRGINVYQFHQLTTAGGDRSRSADDDNSDRGKTIAPASVIAYHSRVYAVCESATEWFLETCDPLRIYNQLAVQPIDITTAPCVRYDVCTENGNNFVHRLPISETAPELAANEYYVCANGASQRATCANQLVFDETANTCVPVSRCINQPNGTTFPSLAAHLADREFVMCTNGREQLVQCRTGAFQNSETGEFSCVDLQCRSMVRRYFSNDIFHIPVEYQVCHNNVLERYNCDSKLDENLSLVDGIALNDEAQLHLTTTTSRFTRPRDRFNVPSFEFPVAYPKLSRDDGTIVIPSTRRSPSSRRSTRKTVAPAADASTVADDDDDDDDDITLARLECTLLTWSTAIQYATRPDYLGTYSNDYLAIAILLSNDTALAYAFVNVRGNLNYGSALDSNAVPDRLLLSERSARAPILTFAYANRLAVLASVWLDPVQAVIGLNNDSAYGLVFETVIAETVTPGTEAAAALPTRYMCACIHFEAENVYRCLNIYRTGLSYILDVDGTSPLVSTLKDVADIMTEAEYLTLRQGSQAVSLLSCRPKPKLYLGAFDPTTDPLATTHATFVLSTVSWYGESFADFVKYHDLMIFNDTSAPSREAARMNIIAASAHIHDLTLGPTDLGDLRHGLVDLSRNAYPVSTSFGNVPPASNASAALHDPNDRHVIWVDTPTAYRNLVTALPPLSEPAKALTRVDL